MPFLKNLKVFMSFAWNIAKMIFLWQEKDRKFLVGQEEQH